MKRVTISDVADRSGVSKSTVSHVINRTRFVEEDTKKRVLEVIEELGYRPSNVARSMVSKRTKTAGFLISDVGNPFNSEVILGLERGGPRPGLQYIPLQYKLRYPARDGIYPILDR